MHRSSFQLNSAVADTDVTFTDVSSEVDGAHKHQAVIVGAVQQLGHQQQKELVVWVQQ